MFEVFQKDLKALRLLRLYDFARGQALKDRLGDCRFGNLVSGTDRIKGLKTTMYRHDNGVTTVALSIQVEDKDHHPVFQARFDDAHARKHGLDTYGPLDWLWRVVRMQVVMRGDGGGASSRVFVTNDFDLHILLEELDTGWFSMLSESGGSVVGVERHRLQGYQITYQIMDVWQE